MIHSLFLLVGGVFDNQRDCLLIVVEKEGEGKIIPSTIPDSFFYRTSVSDGKRGVQLIHASWFIISVSNFSMNTLSIVLIKKSYFLQQFRFK
ncbi:hypothetical protein [Melissococcus plutonius]|uniref:hypothetical protein n=1 Tax=Melissococcus plutonius TaxID=33970 RepID=UPI0011AEAEBA|nr:hypothetical protein [Melissococcus plutonius]